MSLILQGSTSGSVTLQEPAVAGTTVIDLPATSGTLVVTGGAQTVEFAAGSVSTPSITTSGDTNTGIFFSAADTIDFAEGGTATGQFDSSGNFKFNSGYGSVATAYGCRAWVNFNGTGTVAIRASGNVSSITDNGVGDYTVNFTNAMPDANYGYNVSAERTLNNNGDGPKPGVRNGGVATGSIRLLMPRQTSSSGETYDTDWTGVGVSIFR